MPNIVETAVADGRFKTLVAAVQAAGLVETLSGEGPFTVFAPTDDAFAALPAGTVESLLNNIPELTKILTYHVVAAKAPASVVVSAPAHTTVQGGEIKVRSEDGKVFINDAQVIIADIETSNGIIHAIDKVILP
ncbi:MAG: fasciclin domain-containing protein [bacterium]|nr:fasciclin domain-containing protein [bacterium]